MKKWAIGIGAGFASFLLVLCFALFSLFFPTHQATEAKTSLPQTEHIPLVKIEPSNASYAHNYLVSDIHGRFTTLKKTLKAIHFSKNDRLFVLGDSIDRGPNGFEALLYLTKTLPSEGYHIVVLTGNHEDMWYQIASEGTTDASRLSALEATISSYGSNVPNGWLPSLYDWQDLSAADRTFLLKEMAVGFNEPRLLVTQIDHKWVTLSHTVAMNMPYTAQTAADLSTTTGMTDSQFTFRNSIAQKVGVADSQVQVFIGHIGGMHFGFHPNYICLDDTEPVNFDSVPVKIYCFETQKFYD